MEETEDTGEEDVPTDRVEHLQTTSTNREKEEFESSHGKDKMKKTCRLIRHFSEGLNNLPTISSEGIWVA